ncbi:MAG: extracellular solute-binding protein [Phycisphaerales bacterium]|nr:extracellular solute-binding protein [Phycisphaerales bacterium]
MPVFAAPRLSSPLSGFVGRLLVGVLVGVLSGMFALGLAACDSKSESSIDRVPNGSIVLYVSADDALFRPVIKSFEEKTGTKVQIVGDTEATKTFGLVRRLLDERDKPKADLFWCSEPIGVIRLADTGVLRQVPASLDPTKPLWLPLAYRARVIAFHTGRLSADAEPRRLGDLLKPELKGKVGLARPQFGTTRTHMAALLTEFGEQRFEAFVRALKANGARVYDGNSMVVQAIAQGEISAGLTDSDDVEAGKAEKWPVGSRGGTADLETSQPGQPDGAMLIMPHVLGFVAHPGDADAARDARVDEFAAFLLSDDVQQLFISSGAAIRGRHPGVATAATTPQRPETSPDYRAGAENEAKAVALFERIWSQP